MSSVSRCDNDDTVHYLFKVIVIGEQSVGKTSLVCRIGSGYFVAEYKPTIGVDFAVKTFQVVDPATKEKFNVKLQLWDTAGQDRFRSIAHSYYRSAHAALVVYDVTDASSFESATTQHMHQVETKVDPNAVIVLVGNKCDVDASSRQVDADAAQDWIDEGKSGATRIWKHYETSAKTDVNVYEVFEDLANKLVEQHRGSLTDEFGGQATGGFLRNGGFSLNPGSSVVSDGFSASNLRAKLSQSSCAGYSCSNSHAS